MTATDAEGASRFRRSTFERWVIAASTYNALIAMRPAAEQRVIAAASEEMARRYRIWMNAMDSAK